MTDPSLPPSASRRSRLMPTVVGLLVLACSDGADVQPALPEAIVASPIRREMIDWDEYTGQVEAVERVEVRGRVSGYLDSIHFEEGQLVEKSQLLFVIDPRPFRAELERAAAELARAQARLKLAESEAARAERLVKIQAISQEEFDTRSTEEIDARAALRGAEATVAQRRLDLEFTEVRSPIDGRVGSNEVDVGNLISGGTPQSTLLTTVVSLDPVHVAFDADERSYLKYVRLARSGARPSSRETRNPVLIALADEERFERRGFMDFVSNEIEPTTGTIRGRAVLPNADGMLTPGLFVRLRLLGSGRYEALLVPDEAIGTDQSGRYVLVLGEEETIEYRAVEVGPALEGLRIVRSGLEPTDGVVIAGLQRVRPGSKVTPRHVEVAAPESFEEIQTFMEALEQNGAPSDRDANASTQDDPPVDEPSEPAAP